MYNICCYSCFMTWWPRSGPEVYVGQAGTVMTPGTHAFSSCWTWGARKISAMQLCLAGFGYQGGEDAQANSEAFHSISEHPCHWQQERTTASTKQMPKILEIVILPQPHFSCWQPFISSLLNWHCWEQHQWHDNDWQEMLHWEAQIGWNRSSRPQLTGDSSGKVKGLVKWPGFAADGKRARHEGWTREEENAYVNL